LQVVATDLQDVNSDSEDDWLEEIEDPEIEHDPMYRSCDTRVLAGNEDTHLDVPRLLDLLSEKPVEEQAGRLNNRILQFQCLREGLYSGPLHYSGEKMSK